MQLGTRTGFRKFGRDSLAGFLFFGLAALLIASPGYVSAKAISASEIRPRDIYNLSGVYGVVHRDNPTLAQPVGVQLQRAAAHVFQQASAPDIADASLPLLVAELEALASAPSDVVDQTRARELLRPLHQRLTASRAASVDAQTAVARKQWFPFGQVRYKGPFTDDPLAFQAYDPDAIVTIGGQRKTMKEGLRFSLAAWHFKNPGGDPFGPGNKSFPWLSEIDAETGRQLTPMEVARNNIDAMFEFMAKQGIGYYAFHDRDLAPEARTADGRLDVEQTEKNLREIAAYLKQKQEKTGIKLLWGTANLFSHRMYARGAATNPDFAVLKQAAAQVATMLEVTKELGGENYVLWGGREGYYSSLNTKTKAEKDNLAAFLRAVRDHAREIGFTGKLLIEPKPQEPTAHQYDHDVAAVLSFLREYGLYDDFYLNIEANHATLAGFSFMHELDVAKNAGKFVSIDANSGRWLGMNNQGWDVDLFPGVPDALEAMLVIQPIGFKSGGVHFDAKTQRTSTDLKDIAYSHILGMDSFARALIIAESFLNDPSVKTLMDSLYSTQDSADALAFRNGQINLAQLRDMAKAEGEPPQTSGHMELMYEKLQQHMSNAVLTYVMRNLPEIAESAASQAGPGATPKP